MRPIGHKIDRRAGEATLKASGFAYVRARTTADAVAAFRGCDGEARYLAGGQSLLAALNLRLLAPDLLIDISQIDALRGIERRGDEIRIGALTRHADVLESQLVAEHVPLLAAAAPWVAHPAIRNKGTLGGSIAYADPASEFPAVALALNARIELDDGADRRFIAAEDFFKDLYETAAEPGEIVSAVHFPIAAAGERFAFDELARRRGDYAIVGTAMAARFADEVLQQIRIALFSVEATPFLARRAAAALIGTKLSDGDIAGAQRALADELSPSGDIHVSSGTRLHLASVLLRRQLCTLREHGR